MMNEPQSKGEHTLSLASELRDDIELSRLPTEQLLLKVSRLARLAGSAEIRQWLTYELYGYSGRDSVFNKYMKLTGRWVDAEKDRGRKENLASIESLLQTSKMELQAMRIPDVSTSSANPNDLASASAMAITSKIIFNCNQLHLIMLRMHRIKTNVMSLLHKFVCDVYYERVFSGRVESVFEQYKAAVDNRLAGRCGDVLEKFPAVCDRLAEGEPEAVSQALATCRRIIDSFANSIYPASDKTIEVDGKTLQLGEMHVQNRINAYVKERISSDGRRMKLNQSLRNLYSRACAGVHADVSHEEARSLLLNVYLLLGEIISLPDAPIVQSQPTMESQAKPLDVPQQEDRVS